MPVHHFKKKAAALLLKRFLRPQPSPQPGSVSSPFPFPPAPLSILAATLWATLGGKHSDILSFFLFFFRRRQKQQLGRSTGGGGGGGGGGEVGGPLFSPVNDFLCRLRMYVRSLLRTRVLHAVGERVGGGCGEVGGP